MQQSTLDLTKMTLSTIEMLGGHMPGGFFMYQAKPPYELIYVNHSILQIFGCEDLDSFRALTGFTFRGMVFPEDFDTVQRSIESQIEHDAKKMDYVEYRILRKDGLVRWVDDYGHFVETKEFGGIYTVFLSDITEKKMQIQTDSAVRDAVILTLTNSYNTVWLIDDVETEKNSLYHSDMDSVHLEAIKNAMKEAKYTDTKTAYVNTAVAPEDRERMQEQIGLPYMMEQFKRKNRYSVNFTRVFPDGSKFYRVDIGKVSMPGGRTGVMMGFKDVDEEVRQGRAFQKAKEENRKLTEEVQSAAKLAEFMGSVSSLLTNMPAMSFSKDIETGRYLACNQAFAEYAGKTKPEEVVGLTDHEIFDQATADHFVEDDKKTIAMSSAYVFFEDVPDAAGTVIRNLQTTKSTFRDPSGRMCLIGMCVDVTEMTRIKTAEAQAAAKRQELEEKIALQEKLLEQEQHQKELDSMITAMASDYRSVYHVDLDTDEAVCYRSDPLDPEHVLEGTRFSYLEKFQEYCRLHVDKQYQEGFLHFIDPVNVKQSLANESIMAYRYLARRNGEEYYEMLRMAGVRHPNDRDDHIVHAVGVGFTVIDEEMRESMARNEALAEALQQAENANRAKTAFLSSMSHEIRTPMNAIIGLNSLAMQEDCLKPETREYMQKIDASAKHLLGLINDILDMSRIESGRMTLRKEEFSFKAFLDQINTMVMSQCDDKGLTFTSKVLGPVDDFYIGDDMKLRQVLINILSNAIKFTDAPGTVLLSVERTAKFGDQSTLRFIVKDSGIGMDASFLPRIFDSFSQEDVSRSNKYGSTGLGMAITKNIVEMMNGTISVESEKGVGSTFTVVLTLKVSDRKAENVQTVNPKDLKVLVVDDDPIACEHVRVVLEDAGIRSDTTLSGKEALHMLEVQHAKHEPYNLVILDWKMPEMDGITVAKEIRKRYSNETTVIILTAYNWDEIMDEAFHVGVDSFLAKPLYAANILDEVDRIARRNALNLFKKRERASLKGKRILLAEDIMINAEIMKELLGMKEALIDHADNGQNALELFRQSEENYYAAILMDVRMPVMDGLEATKAIRALDRKDAKRVPIIAMTANAFDEDVQMSLQVGMNAHLSKPVEPDHLYQTLEELIYEAEQTR